MDKADPRLCDYFPFSDFVFYGADDPDTLVTVQMFEKQAAYVLPASAVMLPRIQRASIQLSGIAIRAEAIEFGAEFSGSFHGKNLF